MLFWFACFLFSFSKDTRKLKGEWFKSLSDPAVFLQGRFSLFTFSLVVSLTPAHQKLSCWAHSLLYDRLRTERQDLRIVCVETSCKLWTKIKKME